MPGRFQLCYFHTRLYRHSVCLALEWGWASTELNYTGVPVGVHSGMSAGL
jgi:hypothetical protein